MLHFEKVTCFNVHLSGVCQGAPELSEDPDNPSACSQNEGQNKSVIKDAVKMQLFLRLNAEFIFLATAFRHL